MVAQDGGGDDDVLRRLMRASSRAMPFGGGCDAHLCLSEGFTLWDFCWKSWSEPLE